MDISRLKANRQLVNKGFDRIFFMVALLIVPWGVTFAQGGALLGGAAGQGPIRMAEGTECNDCEYINNFMFGSWSADAKLVGAHKGLQELKIDVNFTIDNLRGFSGRNVQGGISSYSTEEFDFTKRTANTYEFEVKFRIRGPESKKTYYKTSRIKVRLSPGNQSGIPSKVTRQVIWTFGPGELLSRLYKFDTDGTSMGEVRDTFKLEVDSWQLLTAYYPYLKRYDQELGKLIAERENTVRHDQLVRQAYEAQRNKNYKKARDLFEEALSYKESEEARGKYNQLNEYIEKTSTDVERASDTKVSYNDENSKANTISESNAKSDDPKQESTELDRTLNAVANNSSVNSRYSRTESDRNRRLSEAERQRMVDRQVQAYNELSRKQYEMFFGENKTEMDALNNEISSIDEITNALKSGRTEDLTAAQRQELEQTIALYSGTRAAAKIAGGAQAEDVMEDGAQAVGAALNWLEAKREQKAAERRRIFRNRMKQAKQEKKIQQEIYEKEKELRQKQQKLQEAKQQKKKERVSQLNTVISDPFAAQPASVESSNPSDSNSSGQLELLTDLDELFRKYPPPKDFIGQHVRLKLTINAGGKVIRADIENSSEDRELKNWIQQVTGELKYSLPNSKSPEEQYQSTEILNLN